MMNSQPASSRPQLRLFSPEESPHPTLSGVFETVCEACLPTARPRNLDQYRETLKIWEALMGYPPAAGIDRSQVNQFRIWLEQRVWRGKVISSNTVRKHCVHLQAVIDMAGPATRNREDAAGVLAKPPKVKKPAVEFPEVEVFTLDEIGAWLDSCYRATMPELPGIEPAEWWRAVILFDLNVPFRLETLLHLERPWVKRRDEETWISVPRWAMKGKRSGKPVPFYLNRWALDALERLRCLGDEGKIFPMPNSLSWLHAQRRKLLTAAGIPKARQFGFHALRKTCSTLLEDMGSHAAAKLHLGHSQGKDVTHDFYTHRSIVVAPVNKLPQPHWHPDREGRQILLF